MMGLEACAGITSAIWMEKYEIKNIEGAVVFSRNLEEEGNNLYPTKELGEFAYKNLQEKTLYSGQVGAGTRASHGQGIATGKVDGFNVLCIVVNNAVGDVVGEPVKKKTKTGKAGVRKNTAITMVITDMVLDPFELRQMATQLHASMARSIEPFNTFEDGDILYMCSTQTKAHDKDLLTDFTWDVEKILRQAVHNSILK
jgi:L-aminopeptidase/D-esterase-like protein